MKGSPLTPRQQRWTLEALVVSGAGLALVGLAGLLFGDVGLDQGDVLSFFQFVWGGILVFLGVRQLRRTPMR